MCMQKYLWDLCSNEGSRAGTMIQAHILDPLQWWLQSYRKHIGPTLHVGHNYHVCKGL